MAATACTIFGAEKCTHTCLQTVYLMVLQTNLLSILSLLIEIFSRAHAKGGTGLSDFKFGTFIGGFPSDGAASMAVKGLKSYY